VRIVVKPGCANEVGALGVLKNLLKGDLLLWSYSGVREEWSRRCRPINEAEIKAYTMHMRTRLTSSDAVVKVGFKFKALARLMLRVAREVV
jgi:hypothetical protein